jgi:hypothetical protein
MAAAHAANNSMGPGDGLDNDDSGSQVDMGELPPLPSEFIGGPGTDAGALPLLLQHVVSDPETGAQTVELVLYDPASGNWAVVPPELAAGLKFVQGDDPAEALNLEFPLDGNTNVRVEHRPMLPPMPAALQVPAQQSAVAGASHAGSTSPARPKKHPSPHRSRPSRPIPSKNNTAKHLYPTQSLYAEPAGEDSDAFEPQPDFTAFRTAFRNRSGTDSLDSTPRSSRTNSLAVDDSGSSARTSRSGSPLGKRAFAANADSPDLGAGMLEMALDGVKKPKKLYYCGYEGCGMSFTTSGHLSR